jgi:ABC-type multidrug transport system ATPase subunit
LLDEPTTGVDAEGREVLAAAVRTLAQNGCTVVVSTHQYGDADRMADRLAVFERGQVVAIVPISVAQSTASLVELGGLAGAEVSDLRAVFEQAGRRTQSKFTYWTIPSEVTAVGMVSGIVDLIGREPGWRVLPPGIEAYLATHGERS